MIRDYTAAKTNTVVALAILGSSETPSIARNNFPVVRRTMEMVTARSGELWFTLSVRVDTVPLDAASAGLTPLNVVIMV